MKSRLLQIWKVVSNPFLLATVLFIGWMLFFDSNSYVQRSKQNERLKDLENSKALYESEILRLGEELKSIEEDPEQLEKFAREKFFYKEQGEDIFILEGD